MYRASPPRTIPAFTKTEADAVEVFGVDFDAEDFVNLEDSRMIHEGGFAHGVTALLPDKYTYDLLVFSFGPATLDGTTPDVTLQLWGIGSEAEPYLLGTSELGADGQFPPILADNRQERYYLAVGAISGSDAKVSVTCKVSGTYRFYIAGNR